MEDDVLKSGEAPPAVPASAPASTSVECPECGAKLMNVSVQPGAAIRCLNCGAKFSSHPTIGATTILETLRDRPDDEVRPTIREPKSAGYWLLRIPAVVYFIVAAMVFCIWIASLAGFVYSSISRGRSGSNDIEMFFFGLAYLPLLPLSGYFLFAVTRSLSRVEANTLKAAWNDKLILGPLPIASGSSLPYILPLAVGPVVIFIICAVIATRDQYGFASSGVLPAGLIALGCFFVAFMVDDLRQFIWRQKSIAGLCAEKMEEQKEALSNSSFPWLGLLPSMTVVYFAIMFGFIFFEQWDRWGRRYDRGNDGYSIQAGIVLTILTCALPLFLTGRNFANAIHGWRRAVGCLPGKQPDENDAPTRWVRIALFGFAGGGAFTVISAFWRNDFSVKGNAFGNGLFFVLCLILTCGALNRAYVRLKQGMFDSRIDVVRILCAVAYIILAIFLAICVVLRDSWFFGNDRWYSTLGFVFAVLGGIGVCATLAQIFADVRKWRKTQEQFWIRRRNLPPLATLSKIPRGVLMGTLVLVGIQTIMFVIMMSYEMFRYRLPSHWEELMALPLLTFMAHFPTIWTALLTREFLLAEETTVRLNGEQN